MDSRGVFESSNRTEVASEYKHCTCQDFEPDCLGCGMCPYCCSCEKDEPVIDTSKDSRYGLRGDAHIGEASHPGPGPMPYVSRMYNEWNAGPSCILRTLLVMVSVLSICDGMGCAAMALKSCSADVDRYVAIEIDNDAKRIAQFANPREGRFPGIDHSVCSNMYHLTEQQIIDMGRIVLFIGATPCGDFSKLRLLPERGSEDTSLTWQVVDPRPGLKGPNGHKFRQLIVIWSWVLKRNPDCEYFIENLYFDDLQEDWTEVCQALGEPIVVNAQDYSRTKRNRA